MGWTRQLPGSDQLAITPGFRKDIHVLMLQSGGKNEVLAAAQHAGRLRSPNVLAAAECDEIGAFSDKASQIFARRQLRRGVHDHGNAMAMRNSSDLGQAQTSIAHSCQPEDR